MLPRPFLIFLTLPRDSSSAIIKLIFASDKGNSFLISFCVIRPLFFLIRGRHCKLDSLEEDLANW